MILLNPHLKGRSEANANIKDFPHLYNENGDQVKTIYIYMIGGDLIVETIESDIDKIKQAIKKFIDDEKQRAAEELKQAKQKIKALSHL